MLNSVEQFMRNKPIYIIMLASLIMLTLILSIPVKSQIEQTLYPDYAINQYNSTCIESSNWEYIFINNTFSGHTPTEIWIKELKQLGNKSVLADVY